MKVEFEIDLRKENNESSLEVKIQNTGKELESGWWLILAEEQNDLILSVKKIKILNKHRFNISIIAKKENIQERKF